MREWPTRYFGNFIDHFGAFTNKEVSNISFKAIARSLFGINDFELGAALSELQQSKLTDVNKAYAFPLPARMGSLLMPTITTYLKDKVHPELVKGLLTEQLLKMLQFGRWSKYRVKTGLSKSLSDVLREELKIFEDAGFGIREDFQVIRL